MTALAPETAADLAWFENRYAERPSLRYIPGRQIDLDGNPIDPLDNGQLQFHRAPHVIRTCSPGNGWGKSAVIAVEVDWWGFGDHPWPTDLPTGRPRQMIWIAQKHQQWELLRKVIEPWWPAGVVASWRGQPHFDYRWPDGSSLTIITSETSWTTVMGIEPDLVVGDEEIPRALAQEMRMRRRSNTRTRYVFNGTALQGMSWVYRELYQPWREYHLAQGITDEREMMRQQLHRFDQPELAHLAGVWCWPRGGHKDNPTATKETWAMYKAQLAHCSEPEQDVRLNGGYRDFADMPVFPHAGIKHQEQYIVKGTDGAYLLREAS